MDDKIILATGATGRQGGAVVRQLLSRGFKVRAITRNPEKPSAQALKAQGVQVYQGDMEDVASLQKALKGVYGVFSVQNYWERGVGYQGELRQARNLTQAAHAAQVSHFVQASIAGCDNARAVEHFESKWETEQMIDALSMPRTFIRTVFFMENYLDNPSLFFSALSGALKADTQFHMIAVDDIGWFVAEAFANPEVYLGKTLDIAGDVLTVAGMKQIYKKVTGKQPPNLKIPFWILKLLNAEGARQFRWNNEIGWHFDIQPLRELHPQLISFETFLRAHS